MNLSAINILPHIMQQLMKRAECILGVASTECLQRVVHVFGACKFHDVRTGTKHTFHYNDVTMDSIASQITSLTIVYSAVYLGADQRKHQGSVSLAFVRGIHRGPVNSPHKWPVTRKMFPFDDVIMPSVGSVICEFTDMVFAFD